MTEQKIGKAKKKYGEEIGSVMRGRVRLMTNLSSVSLIALMRKYHHLPALLFSHAHSVKPSFSLILNFINPSMTLSYLLTLLPLFAF